MKRKVIRQASQAYTITLPIDWVRKNKIDKNSEIDIKVSSRSLIINSNNPQEGGIVNIDLSNKNIRTIHANINALYAKGIDTIEVTSKEDITSLLTKSLNFLIGYALISQKDNKYIIKDISPSNYSDLDEIFKRVFQMILLFYDSAIKDVFGKEEETLDDLLNRDREVNKFCLYLQRAINKSSYENDILGRTIFTYSFNLEKISDEIQRLWRTNIKYKVKKSPEIKKLALDSKEGLEIAFDLYFNQGNKKIENLSSIRDKVRENSMKIRVVDPDTQRFIRHIVKIVEDATDLNHLALMKQL